MHPFLALALVTTQPALAGDFARSVCEIPVYVDTTTGVDRAFYATWTQEIHGAVALWNSADAGFHLKIVSSNYEGDRKDGAIVISAFDTNVFGPRVIGNTFTLNNGIGMIARSRVLINSKDTYCTGESTYGCYSLKNVALHEIGHALGLTHTQSAESIMAAGVNLGDSGFDHIPGIDAAAVQALFPSSGSGCENSETSLSWSKVLP